MDFGVLAKEKSCEAVPGYMDAMEMEFRVREPRALAGLKPGSGVKFTIVTRGGKLYAEDIHENSTANFESEPMQAGELSALANMLNPAAEALADFEGKVVALTFGYSRCPNPNYCLRLSNNLARVAQRLHSRDLILITIMIYPEHDRVDTLIQYAAIWCASDGTVELEQGRAKKRRNHW